MKNREKKFSTTYSQVAVAFPDSSFIRSLNLKDPRVFSKNFGNFQYALASLVVITRHVVGVVRYLYFILEPLDGKRFGSYSGIELAILGLKVLYNCL